MDWRTGGVCVCLVLFAACGGGVEGPERQTFDDIESVEVQIDRGEVSIVGSQHVDSAIVDRWRCADTDYSVLEQRAVGGELIVDSVCGAVAGCHTRYELGVDPSTPASVRVDDGEVNLAHLTGELQLSVGEGGVNAVNLAASIADLELERGKGHARFSAVPSNLRIRLGEEASMRVVVPDQTYRCEFDPEADDISADRLDCNRHAGDVLRVEPSDAHVVFEVADGAR